MNENQKLTLRDVIIFAAVGEYLKNHFDVNPLEIVGGNFMDHVAFTAESIKVSQETTEHKDVYKDILKEIYAKAKQ